jgi:hypothetical protein
MCPTGSPRPVQLAGLPRHRMCHFPLYRCWLFLPRLHSRRMCRFPPAVASSSRHNNTGTRPGSSDRCSMSILHTLSGIPGKSRCNNTGILPCSSVRCSMCILDTPLSIRGKGLRNNTGIPACSSARCWWKFCNIRESNRCWLSLPPLYRFRLCCFPLCRHR